MQVLLLIIVIHLLRKEVTNRNKIGLKPLYFTLRSLPFWIWHLLMVYQFWVLLILYNTHFSLFRTHFITNFFTLCSSFVLVFLCLTLVVGLKLSNKNYRQPPCQLVYRGFQFHFTSFHHLPSVELTWFTPYQGLIYLIYFISLYWCNLSWIWLKKRLKMYY